MVDPGSGQIRYAVLSFGGILGMGDKYFAIPWSDLHVFYKGATSAGTQKEVLLHDRRVEGGPEEGPRLR